MSMLQVTKRALAMALVLSWAGGCDPAAVPADADKGKSEPGKAKAEREEAKPTEPVKPKHPVIGAYLGCFDGCAGKSADNQPTCHKNCAASVTAGTGDPATSACPRGCTEAFGSCLAPCESKNEDDAATCRKQCEVLAEKCVVACK
jgi:hypothetical protein